LNDADKFYFKPTILEHFMLTSENGRYLSSILSAEPAAGKGPGKFSEYSIDSVGQWLSLSPAYRLGYGLV